MKPFQKHALITSFKKWLFPPSPSPQIFLALRGTNVLGQPKDLSVSLKLGRSELKDAQLPFTEDFLSKFKEWSSGYLKYAECSRSIAKTTDINPADSVAPVPNISVTRKPQATLGEQTSGSILDANTFDGVTARFERSLYDLLNNDHKFSAIRDELIRVLPPKGKSQPDIYIQYEDPHLAELPLHLWSVFQERGIEPVFSSLAAQAQKYSFKKSQKPRILLLLGDSSNLDLQRDIIIWKEQFPNAEIKDIFVKHQSDVSKILWNERWDILYFAGHSETEDGSGKIYLSDDVSITFNDLQQGLKQSVSKGLRLAIFNSCISLGAAADLQKAGVPTIVAMRHIIHDTVAPKFLEYFLEAYLNLGKSIKNAVQIARYRLKESEETNFRCASWLPVVFQIPTIPVRPKPSPLIAIAISFFVTCLVMSIHTLGLFQSAELNLYDHMMNARAAEPLDPRIVLIHIDKQDQEWQESRGAKLGHESIDDEHLAQLFKRLDEEKPKVIGMSLARKNLMANPDENKLFIDDRILSDSLPNVIANCSFDSMERGYFPEIMRKRNTEDGEIYPYGDPRIGFANITVDSKSGNTRRLLLMQNLPNSECGEKTWISFPLRIVLSALDVQDKEIEVKAPKDRFFLKVKNVEISNIVKGQGGYQIDPDPSGNELAKRLSILFNHKNNDSDIVPISLKSILTRKNISLKDKIVIIGGIGKDTNENVNNIYIHTLAVNYLLRVFEGGSILQGVENDIYFFIYCYIQTFLVTLLLQYLSTNLKYVQFSIFFFVIALSSLTVNLVNFKILENLSIWIPSIPILVDILISCLVLSIYCQKFDRFIRNKQK